VSRTRPTAQTEGVQARVAQAANAPPLARHKIKHVNRYDLSNEYRVSGRTLPIERCSVPATRTQLNSRVGPRSPPPWNSPVTNSFCLNADAL
jgi:hypothetical protein